MPTLYEILESYSATKFTPQFIIIIIHCAYFLAEVILKYMYINFIKSSFI